MLFRSTLEIPIRREVAQLYHYWPSGSGVMQENNIRNSGDLTDAGLNLPFKPCLWLGKEEAGVAFYAETDEHWEPFYSDKALEVCVSGDIAVLRVHLLDFLPSVWQGKANPWQLQLPPIRYSFGLQATPVKPFIKQQQFERVQHNTMSVLPKDLGEIDAHFKNIAALGAKWQTFHEDWTMIQNYGLPEDEAYFKKIVALAHENGIKVMVYFGYEYSTMLTDFFEHYEDYLIKAPDRSFVGGWQRLPEQHDYKIGRAHV